MSDGNDQSKLSRRRFLVAGSAVLVAAAGMQAAQGQQSKIYPTDPHTGINESQPGPKNNTVLDGQNEDSAGAVLYLPISKTMAGVEMRLISGGIRELHWHVASEWALMLYGSARITAV